MSQFLETLKIRMVDAQKRLQEATVRLQAAQAEHQAAAQECSSWQNAVNAETRKEALAQTTQTTQSPTPLPPPPPPAESTSDTNKSELIRQALRDNPGGLTPVEVWRKLKNQIHRRSYVYAVLGRLKDREQVSVRRGKYYFRVLAKGEDAKDLTIQ